MLSNDFFSYWETDAWFRDVDLAIIGSGITGLSSAIFARQQRPDWNILVLESGVLPYGATTRNAGFACFGSLSELADDQKKNGREKMAALVRLRWKGLQALRELHGDAAIGFEQFGGYEIFTEANQQLYEECMEEVAGINATLKEACGFAEDTFRPVPVKQLDSLGFSGVTHAIYNPMEGQLHSGMLMQSLLKKCSASGIPVLNRVEVEGFEDTATGVKIRTSLPGPELYARRMLVCTNGFAAALLPGITVKPARGQVLVTSPIEGLPFRGTFHHEQGFNYFRNIGNRVLLGGGRHLDLAGEETTAMESSAAIRAYLLKLLEETILPGRKFTIAHAWSGIMGMGPDKAPVVQQCSEHVYCAVRMGGMGVAIGTEIGRQAAEMLKA